VEHASSLGLSLQLVAM